MKYFIVVLIILAVFVIVLYPLVNNERVCYETSNARLDQISGNVLNLRITKDIECSQSTDVLDNLETCMQDATASSVVAIYANDMIQRIVAIIRPYEKNLWTLKAEHNQSCAGFSWYQLL